MTNDKRQPHILVVEDEEHLATGIKFNLLAEGYQVTTVGEGPAALQALEQLRGEVDLLILDLMLPGMSGYAVCEAVRKSDETLPILILSARTLSEDRTRGFQLGANQYMTKPFDLDEFLTRVRNLLRYARRLPSEPPRLRLFQFGTASINFDTFEVTVGERPVRLTQLEMTLLRHFIENEGRVIPRRELLEEVWDLPGNLNTRAPDQFVRRLRTTFEPDPAQPRHFLTIRDAGYRFVAHPTAREEVDS